MRLIDADKLKEDVLDLPNCPNEFSDTYDKARILDLVDEQPAVDAEPVKHGHWIEHEVGLICSECGHYTEAMYDEPFNNEFGRGWALKRPYYCGYCGAKMDEVEE